MSSNPESIPEAWQRLYTLPPLQRAAVMCAQAGLTLQIEGVCQRVVADLRRATAEIENVARLRTLRGGRR